MAMKKCVINMLALDLLAAIKEIKAFSPTRSKLLPINVCFIWNKGTLPSSFYDIYILYISVQCIIVLHYLTTI